MSRKKLTIDKKSFTPLGGRIDTLLFKLNLTATSFAKSLNITEAYLSRLMRNRGQGGDKLWRGIKRVYPAWESFLRGETSDPPSKTYPSEEKRTLQGKEQESAYDVPGQLALPELEKYRIVQVITPDEKWQLLNLKLDKILDRIEAIEHKLKDKP